MKLLLGVLCSISTVLGADASNAAIRDAATKAVALIQKSQQNWYSKQSCFSCHQQLMPALAFRAARQHGIPVDEAAAHSDAASAFGYFANLDRAVQYTHIIDPTMDDGFGLMAASATGLKPSLVTAVYARSLAARQEADGHWETVDERPPQSYSPFTATAVAISVLQLYSHASLRADASARVEKARAWLVSHQAANTEERAYQIFGVSMVRKDPALLDKWGRELKATQQPDGGWASLDGRPSDAYATGEALWALAADVPTSDASWRRGASYLLKTQAPDGSWHVASRLHPPAPVSPAYFETGHPYGHDQFISSMGESWAIIALAQALPRAEWKPSPLKEAEPQNIEPWAETVLFGSVADVKRLLDGGFNSNSATKSGGTTALMLATPDVDKMKLLLDRGANADARAKNRYSALLVAANYPGSTAAMNLLLDHGASVRLPKGQGAPLFNAQPILLAAFAGNAGILNRLHKSGDRVDDKMNLLGMFPVTPLLMLATTHRTEAVRALLDEGARVDEADDDGITILSWAAIANRVEMARLLIKRGADVNHVDKKGMTPLLYAASIDFGESAMIDLLLRSGAQPGTRNKEGLTALELARKYHHTHLLASLEGPRAAR
ncbi:MAG TPA: ankyrin repeat domain-containing protein [Bryobacteraceae bacterium]|jgi:ankyrin repeat protein|nr:ankyrin repeat domain-containing protein [Bryobacteraceae bacterium]